MSRELLPCPFCGEPAYALGYNGQPAVELFVTCKCGARGPEKFMPDGQGAIEAWNTRAPVSVTNDPRVVELVKTLEGIRDADWRKWEELASPEEFMRWAKARANHALANLEKKE